MGTQFRKTLIGYKPDEVIDEIQRMKEDHDQKVSALRAELESARAELDRSEQRVKALQDQLNQLMEREHRIAEVIITAQINAERIEREARQKAEYMRQQVEAELQRKQQEMELLRRRIRNFKAEFREMLDQYKLSLDSIKDPGEDTLFIPTVIVGDKERNHI